MRQFLVYVAIIAGFTFIIFAMWDFDVWVLVAGWVAVSFSVVAYHTTDRIADHIHYHTWSKYLGAERPDSKPELHAAIKNYEKHPTEKNRARVIDLASNDKKIN